ncbi:hypothetical protein AAC387_Pa05g1411 [Persea americana]
MPLSVVSLLKALYLGLRLTGFNTTPSLWQAAMQIRIVHRVAVLRCGTCHSVLWLAQAEGINVFLWLLVLFMLLLSVLSFIRLHLMDLGLVTVGKIPFFL